MFKEVENFKYDWWGGDWWDSNSFTIFRVLSKTIDEAVELFEWGG